MPLTTFNSLDSSRPHSKTLNSSISNLEEHAAHCDALALTIPPCSSAPALRLHLPVHHSLPHPFSVTTLALWGLSTPNLPLPRSSPAWAFLSAAETCSSLLFPSPPLNSASDPSNNASIVSSTPKPSSAPRLWAHRTAGFLSTPTSPNCLHLPLNVTDGPESNGLFKSLNRGHNKGRITHPDSPGRPHD
ncbi:hypothetical protein D9611_008322 [Ephemerocybe angulata]|uniref:Uncharacterized protein n=1 Tax=Ephemerocybe angulata TaxID=980116 RepID=A0A8H5F580_9AGAR|nr:hypothetical protein D9611_008322 [Tulosesus angulatus]